MERPSWTSSRYSPVEGERWAERGRPSRAGRGSVSIALEIVGADGLAGLSMRKLAGQARRSGLVAVQPPQDQVRPAERDSKGKIVERRRRSRPAMRKLP